MISDNMVLQLPPEEHEYVMWRLMHVGESQASAKASAPKPVPLIVIEIKHQSSLSLNTARQAISYFTRAKHGISNYSGVAFLLNEWNNIVQFRILLFPFCTNVESFGAQAVF